METQRQGFPIAETTMITTKLIEPFLLVLIAGQLVGPSITAADIGATTTPTAGQKEAAISPKVSREAVVVYYENAEPCVEFSARELQKTLTTVGHKPVTLKALAEMPASPEACYVVIAKDTSQPVLRLLETRGGQRDGALGKEAYALRKTDNGGKKGYWAMGGDRVGAMYGLRLPRKK